MRRFPHRRATGFTLVELMIVIAIIAILASILIPSYTRARAMSQLTGCKANLKNIATALEAYSVDNEGHYPDDIGLIAPNYMKTMPICPSATADTYSNSYVPTVNPDTYEFYCEGTNHASVSVPADYPKWFSGSGLRER